MMIPVFWHDIYKGRRCFVVGNGPSLKQQALLRLTNEFTICCNKVPEAVRPDVLCFSDRSKYEMFKEEANAFPCWKVFAIPEDPQFAGDWGDLPRDAVVIPFRLDLACDRGELFDPYLRYVACGRTVILDLCLPLAFHLGFAKTYVIGWDNTDRGHHYADDSRADVAPILPLMDQGAAVVAAMFEKHGRILRNATKGGALTGLERVDYDSLF